MKYLRAGLAVAAVVAVGLGAAAVNVARADDATSTADLIAAVERDTSHGPDVAGLLKRAKDAMERATRLRSAGDETHARLADGLAREDAEAARDLARAIDAERAADDAVHAALDAGARGERERALLEEGIARNGRLRAQIEEVGHPTGETKTSRSATSVDATAPRGKAAAAAKDGGAQ